MKRSFVQIAYFVEDIRVEAEKWATERGAGPFFVLENIQLGDANYRGQPGHLDHSSAYGQLGDIMVELVQQNNIGPSAFGDMYQQGQFGLHHMAQFAPDLEAELECYQQQGYEIAFQAHAGEVGFAFIDTREKLGHMVEIYQDCPQIRDFYSLIKDFANNGSPGQVFAELPVGD
mgnify:CR=1 FL=1|jgi:hypothetical protein